LPEVPLYDLVSSIWGAVTCTGANQAGISPDFNRGEGGVWRNARGPLSLARELGKRGYGRADIAKLWGGNFLRGRQADEASAVWEEL